MYIVVFVYTANNGRKGIRVYNEYRSKSGFEADEISPKLTVLKAGVSENEAISLVALTPETSTVKAAIEDAFTGEEFNYDLFWDLLYHKATITIDYYRRELSRPPFHLGRTVQGIEPLSTLKGSLFFAVDACSLSGRVDLNQLKTALLQAHLVFLMKQTGTGPDDDDMLG